ncbi:MAG TPA: PadR family transcriptional regulator [Gemmatimonadaceae bacterium]|jgi:PadR family transcriptional regulator PadR|nr:PadR family transcriptional regulator [Gemmatimonadaceae bacterium]
MLRGTDLDLVQGTLDILVLKALVWGPRHGYAVARWIGERTDEELRVEDGALYTALHRIEKRGWVRAQWGRSENNRAAKYYTLTAAGRKQLAARISVWQRYAAAVSRVLEAV